MKFRLKKDFLVMKINSNVNEIKSVFNRHGADLDHFWVKISRSFNFAALSRSGKRQKRSGIAVAELFEVALAMPILVLGSVRSFFHSNFKRVQSVEKSSFYRFYQDSSFNWRNVLYAFNRQLVEKKRADAAGSFPTALIIDDSTIAKCGRKIEGVSMVYDHTSKRSVPGFKLLAMTWFNGSYNRFLDFALVAEKKIKQKGRQFSKKRDSKSAGFKRKGELKKDKITLAAEMLKRAVSKGFIPDYVLVDTWFTCAELINAVRGLSKGRVHFLGMVKHSRRKYTYEGQEYTLNELRKHLFKSRKRCTRFRSRYISVRCHLKNVGEVRIFFSRFSGSKKWKALLTTDTELSYIKVIETYTLRWNIEVAFKETKQLLRLGKHQARDFDSQVAHTTAILIAHTIMISCKYHEDWQSLGELFRAVQSDYRELLTLEKLLALFEELLHSIAEQMGGSDTVTITELFNSDAYKAFKEILNESLFLNGNYANIGFAPGNEKDTASGSSTSA